MHSLQLIKTEMPEDSVIINTHNKRRGGSKYKMPRVPKPYLRDRTSSLGPSTYGGSRGTTPIMNNLSGKCQNLFTGFQHEIGHMDNTFDRALEDNEKHFLMAYQGHMNEVQKDITKYKHLALNLEGEAQREQRIDHLEKSLEFFKNECLSLSKVEKKQRLELNKWKNIVGELEDDRNFLKKQIEKTKRKNDVYQSSLKEEEEEETDSQIFKLTEAKQKAPVIEEIPQNKAGEDIPFQANLESFLDDILLRSRLDNETQAQKIGEYFQRIEEETNKEMSEMKMQLANEKAYNNRLIGSSTNTLANISELEAFFFQCIEELRKHFIKILQKPNLRKGSGENIETANVGAQTRPMTVGEKGESGSGVGGSSVQGSLKNIQRTSSQKYRATFHSGMNFPPNSIYTHYEKFHLLQILLSNDQLLILFFDGIFGPPMPAGGAFPFPRKTGLLKTTNNPTPQNLLRGKENGVKHSSAIFSMDDKSSNLNLPNKEEVRNKRIASLKDSLAI